MLDRYIGHEPDEQFIPSVEAKALRKPKRPSRSRKMRSFQDQ